MLKIDNREIFLQNINVLIANGTIINTLSEQSIQANRDYDTIIGIGWFERVDGGIADNYLVGFRTDRKTWINPIPAKAWTADEGVGPMLKYYEMNIPYGSGDTLYAIINNKTALSADLAGTMVLILSRTLTELPK